MARKSTPADSLDLLLDTVCNTFGGILFIALLIVILLQLNPPETSEPELQPQVSLEEIELLHRELQGEQEELKRLRDLQRGQQATAAALLPDSLEELSAEQEAAALRRDELAEEQQQRLADIARTAEEIERIRNRLARLEEDRDSARQEVAELAQQVEEERTARRQELRTPVLQSSRRMRSVGLILQFGRLYVWHRYDRFGNRLGLNREEFVILGEDSDGILTTPRPTGGVVLEGSGESHRAILSRMQEFSPERTYCEVVVRPDSYGEFKHLRTALIEAGFEYRLIPTTEEGKIADRGGSDSRVQ